MNNFTSFHLAILLFVIILVIVVIVVILVIAFIPIIQSSKLTQLYKSHIIEKNRLKKYPSRLIYFSLHIHSTGPGHSFHSSLVTSTSQPHHHSHPRHPSDPSHPSTTSHPSQPKHPSHSSHPSHLSHPNHTFF